MACLRRTLPDPHWRPWRLSLRRPGRGGHITPFAAQWDALGDVGSHFRNQLQIFVQDRYLSERTCTAQDLIDRGMAACPHLVTSATLCHYASMPLSYFSCTCLQMSLQGDAWGATAADTRNASRESSTYAYDCSISIRV